ncbi:hypothetical protein BDZ97DRAFT_1751715 [Flammula alnicola]|nr:hypothetical protein BDZ97DRAFT_1751715 [Flammula alnicola]
MTARTLATGMQTHRNNNPKHRPMLSEKCNFVKPRPPATSMLRVPHSVDVDGYGNTIVFSRATAASAIASVVRLATAIEATDKCEILIAFSLLYCNLPLQEPGHLPVVKIVNEDTLSDEAATDYYGEKCSADKTRGDAVGSSNFDPRILKTWEL